MIHLDDWSNARVHGIRLDDLVEVQYSTANPWKKQKTEQLED